MSDQREKALSSAVSSDSSAADALSNEIRYRRHRIVWDIRPQAGTSYWAGKAAVVALGDGSIQKRIHKLAGVPSYTSAEETRRYLINTAKDWIDKKIAESGAPDSLYRGIIEWDESLSVGIKKIDMQHQELVKIINCLVENETASGDSEPIAQVLDRMTQYAVYHFETEEALMLQYNYPDYESHRDDHTQFKMKTAKFCLDALQGKETLPDELLSYLRDWLTNHILKTDMKYKPYFLERGLL
ncbi:MAG: bacteriohemerythrin [Alphaproteobacteria bacterium]